MGERIAAVDAYVGRAQPFARPILEHVRAVVHAACPEVVEQIKWGMPFFAYRGLFCYMAAFKQHAAFGFYRHAELAKVAGPDAARLTRESMGSFGRLGALADLPPRRVLVALVKRAKRLKDEATKSAVNAKVPARAKPAARKLAPTRARRPAASGNVAAKSSRPRSAARAKPAPRKLTAKSSRPAARRRRAT